MPKQPEITVLVNELSPRDYFAAAAMTGLVTLPSVITDVDGTIKMLAVRAYTIADAMLKERTRDEH